MYLLNYMNKKMDERQNSLDKIVLKTFAKLETDLKHKEKTDNESMLKVSKNALDGAFQRILGIKKEYDTCLTNFCLMDSANYQFLDHEAKISFTACTDQLLPKARSKYQSVAVDALAAVN